MLQLPLDTAKLVIMEESAQLLAHASNPTQQQTSSMTVVRPEMINSVAASTTVHTVSASDAFHLKKAEEYYAKLKKYLSPSEAKAKTLSQQRQSARAKLTQLTPSQFQELSTDVYDELIRRDEQPQVPFLPVQPDLHPKRNQARQKLATLPESRYTDLAFDVFFELETRFPTLLHSKKMEPGQFQSLDALMHDLGSIMVADETKSFQEPSLKEIKQMEKSSQPSLSSITSTAPDVSKYEREMESKNKEIQMLQSKIKGLEDEMLIPLQQQVEQLSQLCRKQEQQIQKQQQEYQKIHQEYKSQQELLHELRLDSQHIMQQLRDLQMENETLRRENQESKAASRGSFSQDVVPLNRVKRSASSSILDSLHIQTYRQAAQRLIHASVEANTSEILTQYHQVVLSCKCITEQLEASESQWSQTSVGEKLLFLKTDFSTKVTQMMSLAKQPTPSSDAIKEAVQALSETIEKLVQLVGTSPHTMKSFKVFLETQTETIVHNIQSLLTAMRSSNFNAQFLNIVQQITTTVTDLSKECQLSFDHVQMLREYEGQVGVIFNHLNQCNAKLNDLGNQIVNDPDSKLNRQKLASASYEVAKFTKELVCLLDENFENNGPQTGAEKGGWH